MNPSRRHLLAALFGSVLPVAALPASPAAAAAVPAASVPAVSAPALPLPGIWHDGIDPAAYLVSEKLDGVRARWDGTSLRFRSGRPVAAPAWFTARLPRVAVDGELWLGRGRFDALSGSVRKASPVDAEWQALRYVVFELPGAAGTFAERARELAEVVRRTGWPQLVAAAQSRIADRAALAQRLAQTVATGGEGLMLHLASAPYAAGRNGAVLKLKPQLDTEATVVGYRPGRGKYAGQVGALEMRSADGRRFFIGSGLDDALRRTPPPLGSTITYRYRDLTPSGLPRFASYLRLHHPL